MNWDRDKLDESLSRSENGLGTYNRGLAFAQDNSSFTITSEAYHRAVQVADTLQEIDEIFTTALEKMEEKSEKLKRQTRAFLKKVMNLSTAYESGDLLCEFTVSELLRFEELTS